MNHLAKEALKIARSLVSLNTKFPKFKNMIPSRSEVEDLLKIMPKGTDLEAWTWNNDGRYSVIVFSPQTKNPKSRWAPSASRIESFLKGEIDKRKRVLERREEKRKELAEFKHGLTPGDILSGSWGYDQTNVEFYEVISATDKSVEIREVAQKVMKSEPPSDYVVPVRGKYISSPMKKRVQPSGRVKIHSSLSVTEWDGRPMYQTSSGWGH